MLMATEEPKCACKGVRRCLVCDADHVAQATNAHLSKDNYIYCLECGDRAIAARQFQLHVARTHRGGGGEEANKDAEEFIAIDGVFLQEEVLTADEESRLVRSIDSCAWVDSQSGRRKQDFGPKINFKKKKLNLASFEGLPSLDVQLFELVKRHRLKLHEHSQRFQFANNDDFHFADEVGCDNILKNFHSVEICHLEYCPGRGSSIDPHFDDFWIWGERLVTLNLNSSTVLTLSRPDCQSTTIQITLPARSILVLYGDARYKYHHSIAPLHITDRRLAVTFRELPREFLLKSNANYIEHGSRFLERAQQRIC